MVLLVKCVSFASFWDTWVERILGVSEGVERSFYGVLHKFKTRDG